MAKFKSKWRNRILAIGVAAAALIAGYVFAVRPFVAQMGATMMGPLAAHQDDIVLNDAKRLLAYVPPLASLSNNSLRFVAMPSFGQRWMAVSLERTSTGAHGKIAVLDRSVGTVSTHAFQMTRSSFDKMMMRWDRESDSYWGDFRMWTDGTPLGFERSRGRHVVSGIGNSPCHYDGLGNLAATYIGPKVIELLDLHAPDFEKLRRSSVC